MHAPKEVLPFIYHFVTKQYRSFTFILFASIMSVLADNTIWPYVIGKFVDKFTAIGESEHRTLDALTHPLLLLFLFWIIMELLQRSKGFLLSYVMPKFEANMRLFTFSYVMNHSYDYFTGKPIGSIAHRIDDLPRSAKLIVDDIITVFIPLILSVACSSLIMLKMHLTLSLIFIFWLCIYIIVSVILCIYAIKHSSVQSLARANIQGGIVDSMRNYLNVKIFSATDKEYSNILALQKEEMAKYRLCLFFIEKSKLILSVINTIGISALFYCLITLWLENIITTGSVVFAIHSTFSILTMLWFAADEMTYVFNELGILKQSLELISEDGHERKHIADNKQDIHITKGEIEFKNVTFKYKDNSALIKNQSVKIESRTKVGLVGLSGSGKTTFTKLIMRLFEINGGSILIDGHNIKEINPSSLRKHISFIQQEPILFHRNIMDNIRYGNFNATDEDIMLAAKYARCHDFIERMPQGYKTIVGETGSKLSGGQKQRIAIARAILKDAPILIMDEATASLDTITERNIENTMQHIMKNKTVIIIAHKFSTLLTVDRLLVFSNGAIIEDGTHDELLTQNGHYANLWTMQNRNNAAETLPQ